MKARTAGQTTGEEFCSQIEDGRDGQNSAVLGQDMEQSSTIGLAQKDHERQLLDVGGQN